MRYLSIKYLLFLILQGTFCYGQNNYPLWKGINAGNYNVGFKVVEFMDDSRTVNSKYDDAGKINPSRFHPIQISIWYPTDEKWESDISLRFKDYFYRTQQKNDFSALSVEEQNQAMDILFNFAKYGLKREINEIEQSVLGNTATAAILNAQPIKQEFPVILAGHDGGVWKMSTLSEYLASHGYVVISTGPLSETSRMFRDDPHIALNRRIRTFEVVRGMLDELEFVDANRIGLLGLNSDGMSTLLYQMKNQEADAVINIDGWDGKNNGNNYVTESIYYKPGNIRVPFLEFQQHEDPPNESLQLNTSIFDSLVNSDRFTLIIQDFGHAYLTGNLIVLPDLPENDIEKHELLYSSIKGFLDTHLKNGKDNFNFFWESLDSTTLLFKKQHKQKNN